VTAAHPMFQSQFIKTRGVKSKLITDLKKGHSEFAMAFKILMDTIIP
jgi:hypothetical protein